MAKNPNKIKNGSMTATVIIYIILAILALICIYPVWYVIIISFSRPIAARTLDVFLIPKGFYTGSYTQLFKDNQMWVTYGNTLIYAYPLTSPFLFAKKVWVFFILIPMYFSGGLIPQFIIMSKLGMYNTRWAILVPGVVSMWYIILVRTYFATIPEDLRESARIDGANNYQILWNVYIPTSKPIMAVIAIYTLVAQWNSWYAASIYLIDPSLQPLQLYLRRKLVLAEKLQAENQQGGGTGDGQQQLELQLLSADQLKYTMIVFSTLPMMLAYPFAQKYFVKGVMVGSLKG